VEGRKQMTDSRIIKKDGFINKKKANPPLDYVFGLISECWSVGVLE
jgi:hypothetical protein